MGSSDQCISKGGWRRARTRRLRRVVTAWSSPVHVHVIAARAAKGETVRFVDDQIGTVTLASDMARALVTLVRERPGGTWHVANTGTTSWFEVARYVGTLFGRDDDFATPIRTDELVPAPAAQRPARSDLATSKWSDKWVALPDWREGVARLVTARRELGAS